MLQMLAGVPAVHIQNFTCSTDLSREDILELGRKAPYYRSPNFPVEVTSEFEIIAVSGDYVSCMKRALMLTLQRKLFQLFFLTAQLSILVLRIDCHP